jgi:hypothetical protein
MMYPRAEHPGPDIYDSVLAAIGMLGQATPGEIREALALHEYIAQLSKSARLHEIETQLTRLRHAGYVRRSWRGRYRLTADGASRLKCTACDRCGSRGWCTCHD